MSPAALVARAYQKGLKGIAITDHDCVDGLAEAAAAGAYYGVEVAAGVELSASVGPEHIHLLGYFFDTAFPALRHHLATVRENRRTRMRQMQARLAAQGMPIELDWVAIRTPCRPHAAAALVEAGHVDSVREAFALYLGDGKPAYVPKPLYPAEDALALVHAAGGIGVLAHPGHFTAASTIQALVDMGMDGLETIHPMHDEPLTLYYRQLAHDFGLIETGGSDFHRPDPNEMLGKCTVPYGWLAAAQARARRHKVYAD